MTHDKTDTYWFEVNQRYLGKAYTTRSTIRNAFNKAGMTYAFLPGNLVSIYGIRKKVQ